MKHTFWTFLPKCDWGHFCGDLYEIKEFNSDPLLSLLFLLPGTRNSLLLKGPGIFAQHTYLKMLFSRRTFLRLWKKNKNLNASYKILILACWFANIKNKSAHAQMKRTNRQKQSYSNAFVFRVTIPSKPKQTRHVSICLLHFSLPHTYTTDCRNDKLETTSLLS